MKQELTDLFAGQALTNGERHAAEIRERFPPHSGYIELVGNEEPGTIVYDRVEKKGVFSSKVREAKIVGFDGLQLILKDVDGNDTQWVESACWWLKDDPRWKFLQTRAREILKDKPELQALNAMEIAAKEWDEK